MIYLGHVEFLVALGRNTCKDSFYIFQMMEMMTNGNNSDDDNNNNTSKQQLLLSVYYALF